MSRNGLWRSLALAMTAVAITLGAVAVAGAGAPSSPAGQDVNTTPDAGQVLSWVGLVDRTDGDDPLYLLESECGLWALESDDADVVDRLPSLVGSKVEVWGWPSHESDGDYPRIAVQAVYTEGDARPEIAVPTYTCYQPIVDPLPVPGDFDGTVTHTRPAKPAHLPKGLTSMLTNVMMRLTGAEIAGLPQDGMFEHFLGIEVRVMDAEGMVVSIAAVPGVVDAVDEEVLVLSPNGPTDETVSYALAGVRVVRAGGGGVGSIEQGDAVVVVTRNGDPVAIVASKQVTVWPGGEHPLPPDAILPTLGKLGSLDTVPGFRELYMPGFGGLVDDGRLDAVQGVTARIMDIQMERELLLERLRDVAAAEGRDSDEVLMLREELERLEFELQELAAHLKESFAYWPR